MGEEVARLRQDYVPLLLSYLARRDEAGLQATYELGRDAMRRSVGLLDVVRVHNDACRDVLTSVRDVEEAQDVASAASELLLELVAAYEIARRAFMDVGLGRGRSTEHG